MVWKIQYMTCPDHRASSFFFTPYNLFNFTGATTRDKNPLGKYWCIMTTSLTEQETGAQRGQTIPSCKLNNLRAGPESRPRRTGAWREPVRWAPSTLGPGSLEKNSETVGGRKQSLQGEKRPCAGCYRRHQRLCLRLWPALGDLRFSPRRNTCS